MKSNDHRFRIENTPWWRLPFILTDPFQLVEIEANDRKTVLRRSWSCVTLERVAMALKAMGIAFAALSLVSPAQAQVLLYQPGRPPVGAYAAPGYGGYGTNLVVPQQQSTWNSNPYGSTGLNHTPIMSPYVPPMPQFGR